jgi:hypothetical protein
MNTRLEKQIKWYDSKANTAHKRYKCLQTIEIITATLIPLLSGYTTHIFFAVLVGILGSVIAIIGSIIKLNKYQEIWIEYRSTCEKLKYQKYLYITNCAPYNDADETKENLFVRTIEGIITSENYHWKNNQIDKKNSK